MQLLTTSGYKNIEDCQIGEQLIAYEVGTGNVIINELLGKEWFSPEMFQDEYSEPEQVLDEEGNPVYNEEGNPVMTEPVLIKTKEQIFQETYGDLTFRKINDKWNIFKNQSIWANLRVVHGQDLQIGDIIYNDKDEDVEITSIVDDIAEGWWRLSVSGDHSYIADDLTLHNASRYWVGGGSSANWNATGNTNWGSTSGGSNNASVPTSADDVTFDGAGTNGNTNSTISATITILSLNITAGYTATMTHNAVLTIAGNWTYGGTYTIAGTSGITISAASTITSNAKTWPNLLNFNGNNTKTLVGDFTVNGLMTFATTTTTINKTTNEKLVCNGGITVSQFTAGTIDIYLQGGTWSGSNRLSTNLYINGNVTISGTVTYQTNTMNYVSGTVTTTGSTLNVSGSCTLNTNGITWGNITFDNATKTVILTSNLSINGLLTSSGSNTINKTTSETITVAGGMTLNGGIGGTAKVILTGGTWSASGTNSINTDLDFDGNVTISGLVYYRTNTITYISGIITTTGSTLTCSTSCTLNTNGITWNNFVINGTATLTSNLFINGSYVTGGGGIFNKTTSETVTINGGITANNTISGSADFYLTGGTWSGSSAISNNLYLNGNITISGTVRKDTGLMSYISGTVNTTGSTINILGVTNLNTSPINWNNVIILVGTITLTSNLNVYGTISYSGAGFSNINKTTSEVVNVYGTLNATYFVRGTADYYLLGGSTWTGNNQVDTNLYINGNCTVSSTVAFGYTTAGISLIYQSGTVTTTGSTLRLASNVNVNVNTNGVTWNNVTFTSAGTCTVSLLSNFLMTGLLTISNSSVINTFTSSTLTTSGGMTISAPLSGTADVYLTGGTWSGSNTTGISNNLYLNGDIIINGNVYYRTNVLTYLSGKINSTSGTLNITASATMIGFNKCPLRAIVVTAGQTLTCNALPSGTPSQICTISSSSASNYTIAFQDNFEKMGRFVAIRGANISRPLQLLVTTNAELNTNRSTNGQGIRYYNQSPNGVPRNRPSINDTMTAPAMGLVSDPNFIKQ